MTTKINNKGVGTHAELLEAFYYDVVVCQLRNNISRNNRTPKGGIAGFFSKSTGYWTIGYRGKTWKAHRLIFFYHHGFMPENQVDHIDGNRVNNHPENLREVSASCNSRNCKVFSTNQSGVTGVSWFTSRNKWQVKLQIGVITNIWAFTQT